MTDGLPPQIRRHLDRPQLSRLWDLLHDRLRRNGLAVRGRLRVPGTTPEEREALSLLMRRTLTAENVTVDLADLDARLRASAARRGLVDVVAELRGTITDRPRELRDQRDARQHLRESAQSSAARLGADPWVQQWLDELFRSGTLGRLTPTEAADLVDRAVRVLEGIPALSGNGTGTVGRHELAERVTGTAHGLDDTSLLARTVQRALALALDLPLPADAAQRRWLWAEAGVSTDNVSSTVLTYGLRPAGPDWLARQLRERAEHHAETHLSLRDLRRLRWDFPGTDPVVYVCENPRIVEAAADHGCAAPVVCTSGNATTVVLTLLDALCAAGAVLHGRCDFDWPGVAMMNRLVARYNVQPWRMRAGDYEEHVTRARQRRTPLNPLSGPAREAGWDPELAAAMHSLGVAVHEESALDLLVSDLSG